MRAILCSILLLSTVAAAAPARDRVERALSGFEPGDVAAKLRALGPGVEAVLVEVAGDPGAKWTVRNRALTALAVFPSPAGREVLRQTLRAHLRDSDGSGLLDLRAAALALGALGGEVAEDLVPLLAHPVGMVREAAARGLGRAGDRRALSSLALRAQVERDPDAAKAIAEALGALSRAR